MVINRIDIRNTVIGDFQDPSPINDTVKRGQVSMGFSGYLVEVGHTLCKYWRKNRKKQEVRKHVKYDYNILIGI